MSRININKGSNNATATILERGSGDEDAITRINCTLLWEQTWSRIISLIWGCLLTREEFEGSNAQVGCQAAYPSTATKSVVGTPDTTSSPRFEEIYQFYLNSMTELLNLGAYIDNSKKVTDAEARTDRAIILLHRICADEKSKQSKFYRIIFSLIEVEKNSKIATQFRLSMFKQLLAHYGYKNANDMHMDVEWATADYSTSNLNNGWTDTESGDLDSSLRFEIELKLPKPPTRSQQSLAIMDYNATGVAIPFTS